ncbi:MAG: pyridoxal phosphate-dependent aminotransferase [Candidatus Coatesbacteria bacterium]|nr:pyridoxal phosphate-dependent aminotransferase [Candidatus Coatesbacteria bacterium]
MPRISFPYMEWARAHTANPEPDLINLGVSEVVHVTTDELNVDISKMTINRKEAYAQFIEIKEVIGERYKVGTDEILFTLGASQSNFLAFGALFDYGDEVLIEMPTYKAFHAIAEFYDLAIREFYRDKNKDYEINIDELKSRITARTRGIIISQSHNPSGFTLKEKTMNDLIGLCEEMNIWLLSDEIYLDFNANGKGVTSYKSKSRIVTTQSFTKVFGLGSMRCGWTFAPPDVIEKLRKFENICYVELPYFYVGSCLQVFPKIQEIWNKRIVMIEKNRKILKEWLSRQDKLTGKIPETGVICFLRFKDESIIPDTDYWARKFRVQVVNGSVFGDCHSFRIGYGCLSENLEKGLEKLEKAINE